MSRCGKIGRCPKLVVAQVLQGGVSGQDFHDGSPGHQGFVGINKLLYAPGTVHSSAAMLRARVAYSATLLAWARHGCRFHCACLRHCAFGHSCSVASAGVPGHASRQLTPTRLGGEPLAGRV